LNQESAGEHFRLGALADPTHPSPHVDLAAHAALHGRIDEARAHLATALRLAPRVTIALMTAGDRSQNPRYVAGRQRQRAALRLAGMPEGTPDGAPSAPTAPADAAPVPQGTPAAAASR
jgi:hypothetical protein